ncbi:folylpolyglutamate synthase/dihydrofolate synthase family protein [uncultured Selenomonas sp.]|uniref:bifunctional folylpolyglutamate synthase/dihydrofolate synthase n=1 Tax=uncultured Selenomonas sp. TaxID=159275 RepID=UPI0028D8543A|nr:folylpolyglutamate synthase/dihydrofolate synthase family protein [uncultured Selenomonas sp.]
MDYKESLSYLESLNVFGSKLGLSRIERLTELLGHPERRYRTVHVTGTNGKGSVSAMTAAILMESGFRTGLYTSPHLDSYTERFVIDGEQASEADFAAAISAAKEAAEAMLAEGLEQPTEFEVLTAAAFYYFAEKHVDYAVIEVGLGGLLDSTNVIMPEVAVITNVAMEHADRCGGTLEGVAHHKAGIIKRGVPVVTAAEGMTLDVVRRKAAAEESEIFAYGEDFRAAAGAEGIDFSSKDDGAAHYALALGGAYQRQNAALAIRTAMLLAEKHRAVTHETIARALKSVAWPGRFERFTLEGVRIVVDGAHNPAGAAALKESLDAAFAGEKRVLLLGILEDKDYRAMLRTFVRADDRVVITPPDSARAGDPENLARVAREITQEVEVVPAADAALSCALDRAAGQRILCAAGSLYLIGNLRRLLLERGAHHDG